MTAGQESDKIAGVRLWTNENKDISRASYCEEINAIAKMMEEKYGVVFESNVHIPARYFKNSHISISIRNDHYSMSICVENFDVKRSEQEKSESKRKSIRLSSDEGFDLL